MSHGIKPGCKDSRVLSHVYGPIYVLTFWLKFLFVILVVNDRKVLCYLNENLTMDPKFVKHVEK